MNKELVVSSTPHETKVAILEDDQVVEVYFEREHEYSLAGSIYKGRVTRVLPGMQSAFVNIGLERDAFLYVSDFFEDVEEYDQIVATAEEKAEKFEREQRLGQAVAASAVASPAMEGVPAEPGAEGIAVPGAEMQPRPDRPPQQQGQGGQGGQGGPQGQRGERGGRRRRRRRGGGGRGGFPDSKYAPAGPNGPSAGPASPSGPSGPAAETPAPPRYETPRHEPPRYESPRHETARPEEAVHAPIILPGESLAKYRDVAPSLSVPHEHDDKPGTPVQIVTMVEEHHVQAEAPAVMEEPEHVPAPEPFYHEPEPVAAAPEPEPEPEPRQEMEATVEEAPESEVEMEASSNGDNTVEEAAGDESGAPDHIVTVTGEENPDAQPASGEAQVREPQRVPRYMSRRMRRKMGKDQGPGQGRGPEPRRDGQNREGQPRDAQPREGRPEPPARTHRGGAMPLISELLKEGQEIIVQIAKEPMGKKGARITSHIALPGRYLVYMPTVDHVGVSRRISSDEERQRLKRVLTEFRKSLNMPGGFIVRTAAEGRSDEDLRNDVRFLFNLWRECKTNAEKRSAPSLLHRDLNLVERILRDQISMNFTSIWVDYEPEYAKIVDFLQLSQPALASRVKLYLKDTPIFEEFGIQEQINNSLKSKVWLKSGGYIVINQTEALVAIDVNTGKYVGRTQRLEDTIVKTNTDAIKEIVRQIRLRDLGGIIVIDFIDMDERKNRQKVMQALEDALRQDRAPSKALAFNDFGLVAITRKRVKQPLEKALGCVCPYCTGSGFVKSPQTVALEILAEAKKLLPANERNTITLRVNPEVAKFLKQPGAKLLKEMEEIAGGRAILVKGDISLHQENFDFH